MASTKLFKFKFRGGTAAEWTAANPVVGLFEPGVESDTKKFKIGDGATHWNDLPYFHNENSTSDSRNVFRLDPKVAGPSYTPSQRTAHIQQIITAMHAAKAAGAKGLRLEVPNHEYVVARVNTTVTAPNGTIGEALFSLPDCELAGMSKYSAITLDPTTAPSSTGLVIFEIGNANSTRIDVAPHNLTINTNKSVINGGSIFPFAARRDQTDTGKIISPRFSNLRLKDVQIGISMSANTPNTDLGGLFQDVGVEDVRVDQAGNRAVEYAQVKGGFIKDLFATDSASVFHLLSFTSGVKVVRAKGTYVTSGAGVYIGFGVSDCEISECDITGAAGASGGAGALEFHSEPGIAEYIVEKLWFHHNKWGYFPSGSIKRSLTFHVNTSTYPNQKITWRHMRFDNEEFKGDVLLYPAVQNAAIVEIYELHFSDSVFRGQVLQHLTSVTNTHDYSFTNCKFKQQANILADGGTYTNCIWDVTPTIDPAAKNITLINPVTPTPIVTTGLDSSVQVINNIVRPLSQLDPTLLGATWVDFNPDDLAAGSADTWAPSAGSTKTNALTKVGATGPTVIANGVGGTHKLARFASASAQRMGMTAWDAAPSLPLTVIAMVRLTTMAANGSTWNLLTGQVIGQPVLQLDTSSGGVGQVTVRPTSSGAAITKTGVVSAGVWIPIVIVWSAAASGTKIYVDTNAVLSGSMSSPVAPTGLHLAGSGSGNSPYFDGDIARLLVLNRSVADDEAAAIIRWLKARYY